MDYVPVIYAVVVLGVIGTVFGIMLTVADKKFAVETDPRWAEIRAALGGANCGACGFSGCDAFAENVLAGKASVDGCPIGGEKTAAEIARIMGVEVQKKERMVARVLCNGADGVVKRRYEYDGYKSCGTAVSMAGGPKLCTYACVGLGDCMKFCIFNAIHVENGKAFVDENRCTGCGNCTRHCPRQAIQLVPADATVSVLCRNRDTAKQARFQCMKACIGCGLCVKKCPTGAISISDGYARIDYEKCTRCGECAAACPSWSIMDYAAGDVLL